MNDNTPLVSIIITTYKRSDMLKRAIDSALNQTYKNIEIIVVDDNNPNSAYRINTEKVMQAYVIFPNVFYVKHAENMNGATARNTGIEESNGDMICFLDDDDHYKPEKVKKQVEYMKSYPEFDMVYCGWNRNDKSIIPTKEGDLSFEVLCGSSIIYTNVIMVKKEAALKSGGWDVRFRRNQEAAFLLRLFNLGYRIGVVTEVLVEFDVSDRSNASNPVQNEEDFKFFLEVHNEQIKKCCEKVKNADSIIYSYRYRGLLLKYIKHKDFINACKIYAKSLKIIPIRFNKDLAVYCFKRLKGKDVFE